MRDPMTFETRLADAYERYLAQAPVEADPVTVASMASTAKPRGWAAWLPKSDPRRRLAVVGIVALLLLAMAATLVLLVGQLNERPVVSWVYRNEIVNRPDLPEATRFEPLLALRDGRVLAIVSHDDALPTVFVIDPDDDSVRSAALPWPTGSVVRMADGRVMLFGSEGADPAALTIKVGILDPSSMEIREVGPMAEPRMAPLATSLMDGRVLIAGGTVFGPDGVESTAIRSIEVYDPRSDRFARVGDLPTGDTATRSLLTLPSGNVVVVTAVDFEDGAAPTDHLYEWAPQTGEFRTVASTGLPTYASLAGLRDGRVLVMGQFDTPDDTVLNSLGVVWDPRANTFDRIPDAPWRVLGAHELNDGRLLLVGNPNRIGGSGGNAVAIFDLSTGTSTPIPGQRACYPGTVQLADGRIAFIGGLEDCETHDVATGGHLAPAVPWVQYFQ